MKNTDIAAQAWAQNQGAASMRMLIFGLVWVITIMVGFLIKRAIGPTSPEEAGTIGALIGASAFAVAWLASRLYRHRSSISAERPPGESAN